MNETRPSNIALERTENLPRKSRHFQLTLGGVGWAGLHKRKQQVAVLDTATGEMREQGLEHAGDAVERFYAALPRPVTVGIESTGYALWFHALMQRLGHTLLVGEAVKIRAMVVRKTKTDRRDARHLLDLLRHDRFPAVWVPDPTARDLRTPHSLGPSLMTQRGLAQFTGPDPAASYYPAPRR